MLISASGRARWQVLIGFGCFGLFWGAWGAALPAIEHSAGVSNAQLGIALFMIGLGALLSMRITGQLLDRFGYSTVVVVLVIFSMAGVLPSLAHGLVLLSIFMFLLGVASGAADVCINTLAVNYEQYYPAQVLNTAHASFSICVMISSLIVAGLRLISMPGWALLLVSQIIILVAAITLMRSQDSWNFPDGIFSGSGIKGDRSRSEERLGLRGLVLIPAVLYFLGSLGAIAYLIENAWQSWSAILLQNGFGASAALSSIAPSVFAGSEAIGRLLANPLGRRLQPRFILASGGVVAAVGSVLAAQASSVEMAFSALAVTGIGTSVCAPAIFSLTGKIKSDLGRGAMVSSVTTLSYAGFLIGPGLVGLVSGLESLAFALTVVGGLGAVLAVVSLVALRVPAANHTSL